MNDPFSSDGSKIGKILIIDDNLITLHAMNMALCDDFEVEMAESGEAGLAALPAFDPNLILLDIEMEGIDGFETCRRLREHYSMPVIFVSSHDTLEERLAAFDAGGDDFVVKPFDAEVLHRKAKRMVEIFTRHTQLTEEKNLANQMAMDFLKSSSETGVIFSLVRSALKCTQLADLATRLVEAAQELGILCHVRICHADGAVAITPHGIATPLETSILEQSAKLGRFFQFKHRFVVNFEKVTILVQNLPEDEEIAGRLRDNVTILAESAQAVAENIAVRQEAAMRAETMQVAAVESCAAAENLRRIYHQQQNQARQLLDELTKEIEDSYLFLGLTDNQEDMVSGMIRRGAHQILELFALREEFDRQFADIIALLSFRDGRLATNSSR